MPDLATVFVTPVVKQIRYMPPAQHALVHLSFLAVINSAPHPAHRMNRRLGLQGDMSDSVFGKYLLCRRKSFWSLIERLNQQMRR